MTTTENKVEIPVSDNLASGCQTGLGLPVRDKPICKYCLENSAECKFKFVTPCKCTNPVCVGCLRRQVELKNSKTCEICKTMCDITSDMNINIRPNNGEELAQQLSRSEHRIYVAGLINYTDPFIDSAWPQYVAQNYLNGSNLSDESPNPYRNYFIIFIFIILVVIFFYFIMNHGKN